MRHRHRILLSSALVAVAILLLLPARIADRGGRNTFDGPKVRRTSRDGGRARPSDHFFRQRARRDGTIPTERFAAAVEELQLERALLRQRLGTSAAHDWTLVGPANVGGRVNAIVAVPGGVPAYLGAANGGVWRSEDWGVNWWPLTDHLGIFSVGALALNPLNANTLWCGTGDANATADGYDGTGLYVSRDRGATWEHRGLANTAHIAAVAVDPADSNRIYVGAMGKAFSTDPNRGFYRSLDGGLTWTRTLFVNDSTGVSEVVVNPAHPETVYCATWERVRRLTYRRAYGPGCAVWRSADGGGTWTRIVNGLPPAGDNLGRIAIAIAPSRPSRLYASVISGAGTGYVGLGLFRTDDGGESWQRVDQTTTHRNAFGGFGWYFGHVAVHPYDPDDVWVGGVSLLHSTDGGVILEDQTGTAHVDHHALWVDPSDASRVYLGNDGGFYWAGVGTGQWQKSFNLPITQFYSGSVDAQNAAKVVGGTQDNGTLKTEAGPFSWTQILGADGFHALVHPANTNLVLAEWQYCSDRSGIKRSGNNGASWSSTGGWNPGDRYNWNTPFVMGAANPNRMLSGSHRVYRSANAGGTWAPISPDLTGAPASSVVYGTITTVAISPADSNLYLAGTDNGRVWRSQDAGGAWEEITAGLPGFYVTRVVADPADAQVIYVTHSGFGQDQHEPRVFRSADRGTTWTSIVGNLPDAPVNDLVVDPLRAGTLYAGTDLGVFETRNLGETWVPLGGAMPIQPVWDLELHAASQGLYAFTHGRSAWKLDLNTVSLSAPGSRGRSGLALSAPGPNPARASARLGLELATRSQVGVIVFDAAGRRVRELARGTLDPGFHPLAWDLRDDRGARVRAGVYFIRASDGSATRTRRLVVTS
jgi:photosystem II stability/assembly factor-like uncharacterized protein